MTDRTTEAAPAAVPERATQAGEVRARWVWTEPAVWTERMLTALENGVKGGVWNRFFAALGLYSLEAAHATACQLSALRRRH